MIQAIILAAGLGTRLRELITDKPKCMVHVNGRPIIGWQVDALLAAGIGDITIVTGYHAPVLRDYVTKAFPSAGIKFLHSEDYATTNNMYSLWITQGIRRADASLLFMNADVAFDPEVITRLVRSPQSAVAVDEGSYNEESMKVIADETGRLNGISKQFAEADALGSSIDVYFLLPADADTLYAQCEEIIVGESQRKQWTELALHRLLESGRIHMRSMNVAGLGWYEIDNPTDLAIAENLFTAQELERNPPKAYFLDLDGTLYLGNRDIAGAAEFVASVRQRGARVVFLSNNSSKSHRDYTHRLEAARIPAAEADILLSTDAMGTQLHAARITRAYVLGTPGMKQVLARYGVQHTETDAEAVLLGYHTQLTYAELRVAALLLRDPQRKYYASHLDLVCPTEDGPIPDAGAMAELIFVTTRRRPEKVFGKPSAEFVVDRIGQLGLAPADCVMVGDRVYTDMALARAAGMRFLGVLSGESRRADFEGENNLLVASSLGHLLPRTRGSASDT